MPLRLNVKRNFFQRTDRVKGVDIHPTEPWLLANLYNGTVYIWNYNDQTVVRTFEVTDLPVRTAKFVARKQWMVAGSDDMYIRVFNHNTMEKIKAFEAHTDYIRCIAVHPVLPCILSASDDMLIKLWDWEKGWACTQVYDGHTHYVMQCVFNPKDTNTFASASLDRTVKVWNLGQPTPNFTLDAHEKGVNCVDYFVGGDRPFLISGADDRTAKVWDYQTKACVQTLEGHSENVSAVMFHPELPIILTGSEDGSVRIWHSTTYRLENTLNYGMQRVWALAVCKGTNHVGMGFDEGAAMIKIGREEPVASMDGSGKIIWARHNDVQTANIRHLGEAEEADGDRLPLVPKDLGACDLYPQTLSHNPNGRYVTVCGDGEFIVYTALAWRNKAFGSADEFVWAADPAVYATREGSTTVKVFKNFKEVASLRPGYLVQAIYGGALLGVAGTDFIAFYDWDSQAIVRRIDVAVKDVKWSANGALVALLSQASFYILSFDAQVVEDVFESGVALEDDGIEEAFELMNEVSDGARSGLWVGDCFIYNNASWRLCYCVGGEVTTMAHLDRPMYLLGFLPASSRVYLIDKDFGITGYTLLLSLIEYKTLTLRGEDDAAAEILPDIPQEQLNNVAKFLDGRGRPEAALQIATDIDYRFDLAVQLGELNMALEIASVANSESKWKQLGELAMSSGRLDVAERCLLSAQDLSGLLLLTSSRGDVPGLRALVAAAESTGRLNVAFLARFLLGDLNECVDLLVSAGRIPEAAFFARTYLPSRITEMVGLWRKNLAAVNPKAAEALADPSQYANLFPHMEAALQAEQLQAERHSCPIPAEQYLQHADRSGDDLMAAVQKMSLNGSDNDASDSGDGPSDSPLTNEEASGDIPQQISAAEAAGGYNEDGEEDAEPEAAPTLQEPSPGTAAFPAAPQIPGASSAAATADSDPAFEDEEFFDDGGAGDDGDYNDELGSIDGDWGLDGGDEGDDEAQSDSK